MSRTFVRRCMPRSMIELAGCSGASFPSPGRQSSTASDLAVRVYFIFFFFSFLS